ncbi:MAG: hypothetical protein KAX46_00145 [Chromatiaceae bacterium]|nr:hypothetical protein [Chromatiaceae bacterium]
MPDQRPLFRSFASGEISPEAFGRIDLDKLQTGLSLCRNFITLPHGPAQNRPGFEYVIETKYSDKTSVLLPFVYNTDQAYVLELGDQYLRIHTEGGTVLETAQSISAITASTGLVEVEAHGFADGDWVYASGVEGMVELNSLYFKVYDANTDDLKLRYLTGVAVDMMALSAYVSGGTLSRVYEIETPYLETDLFGVHYTQSADVMTLVHPGYQQRQLTRTGATAWSLDTIDFDPNQAAPTLPVATPTGSGTVEYSYKVTALRDGDLEESFASDECSALNNLTVADSSNKITWAAASGAARYNVYKKINGLFGYIGQSSDGATGLVDDNITPDTGQTPPEAADPFAAAGDYPGAVGYFEGRRWFAGTRNIPQGLWSTRSGTESNMAKSIPTREDDGIAVRLRAQRADTIRHIVPLSDLLLLTSGGEWRVTAQNSDAITPTTISYRVAGAIGANAAQPVVTSESVIYAQAMGGRVREMLYSWEAQGYKTNDLAILAAHLFDSHAITNMAYTRSPHQIVWCVRSDGALLGMTYVPEHKVVGWHQHNTPGAFEAVASIPEGNEDRLYATVRRFVGGRTVRCVERMASRQVDDLADSFFVDSGLRYSGAPVTTIRGLHHLEGETVAILADGASLMQQVVSGGEVTLQNAASKVQVGLPIDAIIGLLPAGLQAPAYGLGLVKNVNGVFLRVNQTSGIQVGPSEDRLREYQQRTTEPYGTIPEPITGVIEVVIDPNWGYDGVVYIKQAHPLPVTILAAALDLVF